MHKDLQQILTEACLPESKEIMDALAFSRVSFMCLSFIRNTVKALLRMLPPKMEIILHHLTKLDEEKADLSKGNWNLERKLG